MTVQNPTYLNSCMLDQVATDSLNDDHVQGRKVWRIGRVCF